MNRCVANSRPRATLPVLAFALAAATTLLVPAPAAAQVHRNFPQTALRGVIAFASPSDATLNTKPIRLAPGARIHGTDNMLVMSGTLIGQRFTANYTLESNGMLFEVWLLSKDEAKVEPWPETPKQQAQWAFDYAAQKWIVR
jgi:hypothetical protein